MATSKTALKRKASEILKMAEARGVQSNYFFETTFHRYEVQLEIMDNLEAAIKEYGPTVTKEYVKGRQNLTANPAISEYNKTATAANNTVKTLLDIIKNAPAEDTGRGLIDQMADLMADHE